TRSSHESGTSVSHSSRSSAHKTASTSATSAGGRPGTTDWSATSSVPSGSSTHHGYSHESLPCTMPTVSAPEPATAAAASSYSGSHSRRRTNRSSTSLNANTDHVPVRRRGYP